MPQSSIKLLIPGPWKDRSAFVKALIESSNGAFVAAGQMIYEDAKKRHVDFGVFEEDSGLAQSMWAGSGRSIDAAIMDKIETHGSIAFLSFDNTGPEHTDLDDRLQAFAGAVRTAGGLAVKVLECGMSHGWDRWDTLLKTPMPTGLFQALVVHVPDRKAKTLSSFGMKQFGLPDASIKDPGIDADPAWALFEFNIYLWQQKPKLLDGHTFALNKPDAQMYKLRLAKDKRYKADHEYTNPFGLWHMEPT
jgi:hypothetical protein